MPKRDLRAWVHAFLLAAVALALPLFDVLGSHPEFLVAQDATPLAIAGIAVFFGLGVPGLFALLVWVLPGCASGVIGTLAGLYALRILGTALALPLQVALGGAALAGVMAAGSYARFTGVRTFLSFLAPVALLLPAWFVLGSPVSALVHGPVAAATRGRVVPARIPIVFVVFDELPTLSLLAPDEAIDARRFPSFARLAAHSHWFPRATTVADFTTASLSSLLTGRYPDDEEMTIPHHNLERETLFTLLRDEYTFNVWERVTRLLPPELNSIAARRQAGFADAMLAMVADVGIVWLHTLLPAGLRASLPDIDDAWTGFLGVEVRAHGQALPGEEWLGGIRKSDRLEQFERFIASIEGSSDDRTLHFLHETLPHTPWIYMPSGRIHAPPNAESRKPENRGERGWSDRTEQRMMLLQQQHLLQLGAADRVLGRLLDRLEDQGLYDKALVIVTADHGRAFQVGQPARTPGRENNGEILLVPLLIKTPGQRSSVVSRADAELIDVVPSIAEVLGIEMPWEIDGKSLLSDPPTRPRARFHSRRAKRHRFTRKAVMRSLRLALQRNAGRSSMGSVDLAPFALRRGAEYVGRSVADLPQLSQPLSFELALGAERFAVGEDDRFVPAHVKGWLDEDGLEPKNVVVIVDGVVAAVAAIEQGEPTTTFEAFLPDRVLVPGEHHLEVRAIGPVQAAEPARSL